MLSRKRIDRGTNPVRRGAGTDSTSSLTSSPSSPRLSALARGTRQRGDNLHLASRRGKTYRVEACLACRQDPNGVDERGQTALYIACVYGHVAVAKTLLRAGANVNSRTPDGHTPTDAAIEGGYSGLLRELMWAGANLTSLDAEGYSLPLRAARDGKTMAMRELLGAGVDIIDVVGRRSGKTALILAARGGHLEIVQGLLGAGADVLKGDKRGWTSLHFAAWKGHLGELYLIWLNFLLASIASIYMCTPSSTLTYLF